MKCRDCQFWHNDGDGFGECAAGKHRFKYGDPRACGLDALIIDTLMSPQGHIIMGLNYGCVHAQARHIGGWTPAFKTMLEAIGRHPAAESDPEIIDALSAIEDALKGAG